MKKNIERRTYKIVQHITYNNLWTLNIKVSLRNFSSQVTSRFFFITWCFQNKTIEIYWPKPRPSCNTLTSRTNYHIVASTNTCYYSENQVFGGVTIRVLCSKRGCY